MGTSRRERLAGRIKHEISEILIHELQDPRMGFMTVVGVELSRDMREAIVKVSILGDEKQQSVTINAIKHARGYAQRLLAGKLQGRYVPSISFELDDSLKRSVKLSKTLRESLEEG